MWLKKGWNWNIGNCYQYNLLCTSPIPLLLPLPPGCIWIPFLTPLAHKFQPCLCLHCLLPAPTPHRLLPPIPLFPHPAPDGHISCHVGWIGFNFQLSIHKFPLPIIELNDLCLVMDTNGQEFQDLINNFKHARVGFLNLKQKIKWP